MTFTPIDQTKWPRVQTFYCFSMSQTSFSLTVELDVTHLLMNLKTQGRKFFPTYLWLVTKCLNEQPEFKTAYLGQQLGYYDTLTPFYAVLHDDDKTISSMWTKFDEDYNTFYERYLDNLKAYGDNHGFLCQPQTPPPPNSYSINMMPWISFKHFSVHDQNNKSNFFPHIEAGKYYETADGKLLLPLAITVNHATTDGYHVGVFLKRLQEEMDKF